ncbi:hypothetical protein JCM19302_3064 [Jejuia pallidilutea]|uniref:Uncharacterized protein n=1 Tax=Jejuia pallidilutea TaxID=504487 RepID=A0A090WAE0_9FLAO|nr:hypothetical protein JCM19302_3064 [Jejuia pallidilutea]GAL89362.1 hypothetical protein JCM19538_1356 [Jejuia pallidilutea]
MKKRYSGKPDPFGLRHKKQNCTYRFAIVYKYLLLVFT